MSRPHTQSDDAILQKTLRVLEEQGGDVSLALLADEVGLSGPGLIKRFGTKAKLIARALAPPLSQGPFALLEAGPDERPFREQAHELAGVMADLFTSLTPRLAVMRAIGISPHELFEMAHPGSEPPPLRAQREFTMWLSRCHERGLIREVPFDSVAAMFLGSLQGPAFACHVFSRQVLPRSLQEHAVIVADMVADMLEPAVSNR